MAWDKSVSTTTLQHNGDRIGGYLALFGSPYELDTDGEYFAPDTDFVTDLNNPPVLPALYHHNKNKRIRRQQIGSIVLLEITEKGLWAEAELSEKGFYEEEVAKRKQYLEDIKRMASEGHLGWSSGANPQGLRKAPDGKIERWPLIEGSLTPTPADPRNVIPTEKSYVKYLVTPEPEANTPEAPTGAAVAVTGNASFSSPVNDTKGIQFMAEYDMTPLANDLKAVKDDLAKLLAGAQNGTGETHVRDSIKALEDKYSSLEAAMKNAPLVRGGNGAAAGQKSLGHALAAIKSGRGLEEMAIKMTGESGVAGGYLLPERFSTELLDEFMMDEEGFLSDVRVIPVGERSGKHTVRNLYGTVTNGGSPRAAGVQGGKRVEAGAYSTEEPLFEQIAYNITDAVSGEIPVSKELVDDSPVALEQLLRPLIVEDVQSQLKWMVFNGTGVGEPLGILNSGALADVTPATNDSLTRPDVSAMYSRHFVTRNPKRRWVAHLSMMADVDALDATTGTDGVRMVSYGQNGEAYIKGSRVYYVPAYLPQANSSGAIMLVDFNAYLLFQLVGNGGERIKIRYYDQSSRTQDFWTYDARIDGQPITRTTVAYSDSYTLSPFVRHND